jgi:hypothetical protein
MHLRCPKLWTSSGKTIAEYRYVYSYRLSGGPGFAPKAGSGVLSSD